MQTKNFYSKKNTDGIFLAGGDASTVYPTTLFAPSATGCHPAANGFIGGGFNTPPTKETRFLGVDAIRARR